MTAGEKIRALRKKRGIEAKDLALKLSISYYTLLNWEKMESVPNKKHRKQIEDALCEILSCTREELCADEGWAKRSRVSCTVNREGGCFTCAAPDCFCDELEQEWEREYRKAGGYPEREDADET